MFRWLHHFSQLTAPYLTIILTGSKGVAKTLRLISKRKAFPLACLWTLSRYDRQASANSFHISLFLALSSSWITGFLWLEEQTSHNFIFSLRLFWRQEKSWEGKLPFGVFNPRSRCRCILLKKINIEDINIIKCKVYHPLISYYRDKLFLRTSSKA